MSKISFLKLVSSSTGLFIILFLILHVSGNLKYFGGPDSLDNYALFLRIFGKEILGEYTFLNLFRIVLGIAFILHIWSTYLLTRYNAKASPQYESSLAYKSTTFSSKYMFVLGILALAFLVFHILHFTLGIIHPDGFEYLKVYNNVTISFKNTIYFLIYFIGVTVVSLHVSHGIWSALQSLGFNYLFVKHARNFAKLFAMFLWIGFLSVPIFVYFFK